LKSAIGNQQSKIINMKGLEMDGKNLTRRQFIAAASAGSLAGVASRTIPSYGNIAKKASKLAILGGEPVRKKKGWPNWPYWDQSVVD
jgi:hypothetical protein